MTIRKLGVLANLEKSGVREIYAEITAWAANHDVNVVSNENFVPDKADLSVNPFGTDDTAQLIELYKDSDILVTLGGDGTLLYAAQLVAHDQIPVLSVNLGSLGFHTQVSPHNLQECLMYLLRESLQVEKRMLLQAEMTNDPPYVLAMNDMVIAKSAWGHMVTLRIGINGETVSDIAADALIVASPTGSSAYNYAAGGPVIYPSMEALILNALCTHRMQVSPLVIPGDAVIEVTLRPRRPDDSAQILNDGQPWRTIHDEETLKISRAPMYLPLIVFEDDFFGKLRDKLRWGDLF